MSPEKRDRFEALLREIEKLRADLDAAVRELATLAPEPAGPVVARFEITEGKGKNGL